MADATVDGQKEASVASRPGWKQVTLVEGLLLVVVMLAGVLRLTELARLPLSPAEAERALAVWRFWQPAAIGTTLIPDSPAYFTLTGLLHPLLGDGDAVMRLVPALAGVALVALPWLWRQRLGTLGALAVSALLALSPTHSMVARTAGGDALAVPALLLLFIAWDRARVTSRPGWIYAGAAALGLGLASSPLFYGGLATLALAWLVQDRIGPQPGGAFPRPERHVGLQAAVVGCGTFLALSTLFLWHPAGLGGAAANLGQWLTQFGPPGSTAGWFAPLLVLGRYEIVVVTLGLAAVGWATWRGAPWPTFMVVWFAAALVLAVLQAGVQENVLLLTVPAYLLVGLGVKRAFSVPAGRTTLALFGTLLVVGVLAYFNGARALRTIPFSQYSHAWLALIAVVFGVVSINFVRTWDKRAALQGTVGAAIVLLLVYSWGTAWWLSHEAANDPRERWVTAGTADNVATLTQAVDQISRQLTNSTTDLDILVAVDNPVLRWYLRDYARAEFGQTVPPGAQNMAILTPAGADVALGSDYVGSDFALLHSGVTYPAPEQPASFTDTLRWWFFHQSPATIQQERVILWVKSAAIRP